MSKLLAELSTDQEAKLSVYRDKWIEMGLSTDALDRSSAIESVKLAYSAAGLPEPSVWIWLASPFAGAVGAVSHCRVEDLVRDLIRDRGWRQVESQVWDQVSAKVRSQVWDQVGSLVRDRVWGPVESQVWDQVRSQVSRCCYGSHDASWSSFYDFFVTGCGIEVTSNLSGLFAAAKSCGWWWPFQNACIITPRPSSLHRDPEGRLHHPKEKAIAYPDGWGFFSWHGVVIPPRYYGESTSPEVILSEKNIEVRRALIERYDGVNGKGRFIQDAGARVVDSAVQPMRHGDPDSINELLAIELPADPDGRMVALKIIDPSTGRVYIVRVPPDQQTVRGALAWSFGLSEQEYVLQQES